MNPRPDDYDSSALPTELRRQIYWRLVIASFFFVRQSPILAQVKHLTSPYFFVRRASSLVDGETRLELVISVLLGCLIVLQLISLLKPSNRNKNSQDAALLLMQEQLGQMSAQVNNQLKGVNEQLSAATGQIGNRLDHASRIVGEVKENLGVLSKATEQVFSVGKDIASLQEILRAPKLRGNLGELFLAELLSQVLPAKHFSLQHRFKRNEVVDAVIYLGPAMVPVDSKFPLENFIRYIESADPEKKKQYRRKFRSDVKKHINQIASKYIVPDEGTYDFALMYIPAENVYYETIIKEVSFGDEESLCNQALAKRVIPVSPNSFYAYLQVIVLGFKGLRIEKSAQEILSRLQGLNGDFNRFREEYDVLGKHIVNTRGKYEETTKRLNRLGDRLEMIDQEGMIKEEELSEKTRLSSA